MQSKLYNTCANCQLICVPEKEERTRRYKSLLKGGVVVQDPDGSVKAVAPDEARQHLDKMPAEVRSLYEGDPDPPPEYIGSEVGWVRRSSRCVVGYAHRSL